MINGSNLKLVQVPQAGYAMITPNTKEYDGLCTTGLQNCCGIIGRGKSANNSKSDKEQKYSYLYLCHAHMFTNLGGENFGVKAWIINMIEKGCTEVEIICDDILPTYQKAISSIVNELNKDFPLQNIKLNCEEAGSFQSVILMREGYKRLGELPLDNIYVSFPLANRIGPICERHYPPICIYDGKNEITLEQLEKEQPIIFKRLIVLQHFQLADISSASITDDELDLIVKYYESKPIPFKFIDDGNLWKIAEKHINAGKKFAEAYLFEKQEENECVTNGKILHNII